jgi:hypothetical protein
VWGAVVRIIDGVPCVQLAELAEAAHKNPPQPGATLRLGCVHCGCPAVFVDFLPARGLLATICVSCGLPAMNPIIPEGHVEGSEAPASGLIVQ